MKRAMLAVAALLVAAGSAHAQRLTEQERRELQAKLQELRAEMRQIEARLGRSQFLGFMPETPWAYTVNFGRPRLGVTVRTDDDPATDSLGAVLQAVTPGGPADEAGLRSGDVVVRFNSQPLARGSADDANPGDRLIELARELEDGDTVRVQYRRGRETGNATVVARKLDGEAFAYVLRADSVRDHARFLRDSVLRRSRAVIDLVQATPLRGDLWVGFGNRWSDMELTTVDADLGSYFGTTEGLLVVRAPRDSLLGLKSGDVILRIGGRVPSSPSHAVRILRSYEPGDEIRIAIMRNRRRTEVAATVPERERGLFWEERF